MSIVQNTLIIQDLDLGDSFIIFYFNVKPNLKNKI